MTGEAGCSFPLLADRETMALVSAAGVVGVAGRAADGLPEPVHRHPASRCAWTATRCLTTAAAAEAGV